ncbi:MAG TPA: molybdate ABC transporter substrate-binding protein [Acidobacteriaceae bacterium]|nr:molybdate ABC transporter substrate-binding protein [Acidobacteriaceae bacterium]
MGRPALVCATLVLAGAALVAQAQQQTLRVAAAADLQPVLPGILKQFTAQTGIPAEASYKSSATLATAIINGAPFDLFLAADFSFPERVIAARRAEERQPVAYARGTLVLWTRNGSEIGTLNMEALRDPALKTISIANPQHAPYGRAAEEALKHLGVYDAVKSKLVVAENIAQAAQYADSGNADVGLISLTSALTPHMKLDGHYVEVPSGDYPPILQGAVVVKNAHGAQAAHRLLEFLGSPAIARELAAEGLEPAR